MSSDDRAPEGENHGLRERIADELAHNDDCGPGPVSRQEYLDDADVILSLIRTYGGTQEPPADRAPEGQEYVARGDDRTPDFHFSLPPKDRAPGEVETVAAADVLTWLLERTPGSEAHLREADPAALTMPQLLALTSDFAARFGGAGRPETQEENG